MSVRKYIKQLASESAIYGLSGVVGRFIGFFLVPIYTRIFTPNDYGIISLLSVFASLTGIFTVLALDNSSARWFYDTDDVDDRRTTISSWFWCQLVVSSLMAIGIFVFAYRISLLLTGSAEYAHLVRLVGLGIPLATGGKVYGNWLRYQRRAISAMIFTLGQALGSIGLVLLLVVALRYGLTGLFTAQFIAKLIIAIIAVAFLKSWISPFAFSWQRLRPMLRYALPLIPAAIGLWVMMSMDRIMLKHFVATSEVGIYSVGASLASGVALLTGAFTKAWGPFAYSILRQPDSSLVYSRVLDLYSFLGCVVCTSLALFAPLILRILTTEAYYAAASTVVLLAFGTLLNGSRFIASLGCGIMKNSVPNAISVGIGAITNLGLNLLLIPSFGRNGAAVATVMAWGISAAYLFWASQRNYHIPYHWLRATIPFAVAFGLIVFDQWLLIAGNGLLVNTFRLGLLLTFIPLGMVLGLIELKDIKRIFSKGISIMSKQSTA